MATRLAFTTATCVSPDILILDEAFIGGDLAFQDKANRRIDELIERTEIVILATHRLELLERLCTRVVWMQQGQIVADGEPKTIKEQYQSWVSEISEAA